MKGNRTVNLQKLMKKLLALPVLETMDGKRAIELSRVLESVRASSIAEKESPSIPDELEGICLRCGRKISEEEKAFLGNDNTKACVLCAYGIYSLTLDDRENVHNTRGLHCENCLYAQRHKFYDLGFEGLRCVEHNALVGHKSHCAQWTAKKDLSNERKIDHE